MWALLYFRFQRAVLKFWHAHPAIMAPGLALLVCGMLPVNLVVATVLTKGLMPEFAWLRPVIIFAAAVPSGALLAWALFKWVPMIPREEQEALMACLPKGCVPSRRICMLEHHLILATQGAANTAWENEQSLELGTQSASGKRRPGRL